MPSHVPASVAFVQASNLGFNESGLILHGPGTLLCYWMLKVAASLKTSSIATFQKQVCLFSKLLKISVIQSSGRVIQLHCRSGVDFEISPAALPELRVYFSRCNCMNSLWDWPTFYGFPLVEILPICLCVYFDRISKGTNLWNSVKHGKFIKQQIGEDLQSHTECVFVYCTC
jgi:hypothetical protein